MEELIKRLERVIATGASDEDGMHPISAEAVFEVVKQLSEHSTNLAEVGTDCISRQAAIDAIQAHKHNVLDAREYDEGVACGYAAAHNHICDVIAILPSAQPEIVRCKDCKYAEYIDDVKTLWCTECGQGRTVAPYDFCSYAEKKEVTT